MTGEGKESREARLAAALRENLRRRKAQARGKAEAGPRAGGPAKDFVNHSPDQSDDIPGEASSQGEAPGRGEAPGQGKAPSHGGPAAR